MKKKKTNKGVRRSSRRPVGVARVAEQDPDELLPEYAAALIRGGVRGKYASRYAEGTNVVVLEPDVAAAYPNAAAVNTALRALLDIARRQGSGRAPAT